MKARVRMFILVGLAVAFSLVACSRNFKPEISCNFVQNSELLRVSWNQSTPVRLYFHRSMPLDKYPDMEKVLRRAVQHWNDVVGREVLRIEAFQVGGESVPQKDGYSMVYWMDTWDPKSLMEQARTTIFWSGSQIYEADIRINSKHNFYVGVGDDIAGVDFESLMIHEFGHVLGLAHNGQPKSVMNVTLNVGIDRRTISKVDQESIRCEY